ncbi:hypothetical protein [Aurantimonas sp. Leaf443]|uniref:hypothetical protein n=1 Tax=Aurantimonas sp. Leaf443 TaxID=1736378 RepID=UPI0006FA763A|nr:hypothetical protein [Aurantimonas sp. Leaf443]KQT82454.1 hypothetical protein ASG48_15380 [Aurantimonas sp. Leaf443]
MSDTRADRLERLLLVQTRKRQLDEHRLGEARREAEALAAVTVDLLRSLGEDSILNGYFLEGKAKALKRNEVKIADQAKVLAEAESVLAQSRGLEKRLERTAKEQRREADRQAEGVALLATIDEFTSALASFEPAAQGT